MPVRDRKYEHWLQAIFGGLVVIGAAIEIVRRVALWLADHFHHLK